MNSRGLNPRCQRRRADQNGPEGAERGEEVTFNPFRVEGGCARIAFRGLTPTAIQVEPLRCLAAGIWLTGVAAPKSTKAILGWGCPRVAHTSRFLRSMCFQPQCKPHSQMNTSPDSNRRYRTHRKIPNANANLFPQLGGRLLSGLCCRGRR